MHLLVITIAAIRNVEVENIKLDGWVDFTQLQRKCFYHLDDMQLETNILLQKIKQDHLHIYIFVKGSPICFLGIHYFLNFSRLRF